MSAHGGPAAIGTVAALMALLAEPGGVPAYAWPGGYPIGYLCDDGEYLCGACVNDPTNPTHVGGEPDGWRLEGYDVLTGSSDDYGCELRCAHCSTTLVEG